MAKLIVLFTCFALSVARLLPSPTTTSPDDSQKQTVEYQQMISKQLSSRFSVLRETTESLIEGISTFCTALQDTLSVANGKEKEAIEGTITKLKKAVEDLKQAHPEKEQHALTLLDKLLVTVEIASKETVNVYNVVFDTDGTNEKLDLMIEAACDDLIKHVDAITKRLQEKIVKRPQFIFVSF